MVLKVKPVNMFLFRQFDNKNLRLFKAELKVKVESIL